MKLATVQCGVQTEHPHHVWNEKVWGGAVRRRCAGADAPEKEAEGAAVRNADEALPVEK